MALAHGLLSLANELVGAKRPKRGRPPQAVFRRAASTAYYALFHRLIEGSTDTIAGVTTGDGIRGIVARAFAHGQMKHLCEGLANGTIPKALRPAMNVVPSDLQVVAEKFVSLQEERHRADYDVGRPFTRAEAVACVEMAERAFNVLDAPSPSPELETFLLILPLWPEVRKH